MATIRVRDWTKEQIEAIRDSESHSSHDSVIKSLLKDRELAKFAGEQQAGHATHPAEQRPDTAFDSLSVLEELVAPDNGVLFLWCPNCGNEVAHLTVSDPVGLSVFEIECQRCLTHLDQLAIVAIDIGYPIEQKLVDNNLQADLKACVIDFWDRRLERAPTGADGADQEPEQIVWQIGQYVRNFAWDWPADVPAVCFERGHCYRDTVTDERIEVIESVTDNRNGVDSFEVKRYDPERDPVSVETEILDSSTVVSLLCSRRLLPADPSVARGNTDTESV
jgi:hypothetical protein